MSYWTYINGVIMVAPSGYTQPEKRYILETVLAHLPKVTGSERNMKVHIVQKAGYNGSSTCNEFFERISDEDSQTQDCYYLVLEGQFRDRMYEQTFYELNKFLNRLAKRVYVEDIIVKLRDWNKSIIISDPKPYQDMNEGASWWDDGESAWWEYLLWDRDPDGGSYPQKLTLKYPKLKGRYPK